MSNKISRVLAFVYGIFCYITFIISVLILICFIENIFLPKTLDSDQAIALWQALSINTSLVSLFALQHSGMARQHFKQWWTTFIPKPIERSTYVLAASVILIFVIFAWQPLGISIWEITNPFIFYSLYSLSFVGWLLVALSTFSINHFDLVGLRQVYFNLSNQPYLELEFITPRLYQTVRHPMYSGVLLGVWCTPKMTLSHLIFAILFSAYIFVGIKLEEKDLITHHGEQYKTYQKQVPMLFPDLLKFRKTN
ncbi:methanethiol S-methyltransferase [[Limnothrix rosea] IAM M-220]|uniref:methanethiol S-methyltransferase n=1 Tax=[Limnothrix rosea] IAM M-220 TaxID=454133 RepID=UPI000964FD7C|nr:methanethiol S-methyltransferase [[Limnothrix rosea] IAM M-220]OKH18756.1 hypothetical protein NIES208_04675 [[Limnothrix rosea] IAM M-220]